MISSATALTFRRLNMTTIANITHARRMRDIADRRAGLVRRCADRRCLDEHDLLRGGTKHRGQRRPTTTSKATAAMTPSPVAAAKDTIYGDKQHRGLFFVLAQQQSAESFESGTRPPDPTIPPLSTIWTILGRPALFRNGQRQCDLLCPTGSTTKTHETNILADQPKGSFDHWANDAGDQCQQSPWQSLAEPWGDGESATYRFWTSPSECDQLQLRIN